MKTGIAGSARAVAIEALEGRLLLSSVVAAAVPGTGTINGSVYDDVNGNGVIDAGEKTLAGVSVFYRAGPDDLTQVTTSTDAAGQYNFDGVPAGVRGVAAVSNGPVFINPNTVSVSVTAGQTSTADIPVTAFAIVTGRVRKVGKLGLEPAVGAKVYLDANDNGRADRGEMRQTTTVAGYGFYDAPAGNHSVRMLRVPPHVRPQSTSVRGTIVRGRAVNFPDMVLARPVVKLSGTAFVDRDGDNQVDQGEPLLNGVEVIVDLNRNGKQELGETHAYTNASGRFATTAPAGRVTLTILVPERYGRLGAFSTTRIVNIALDSGDRDIRIGFIPR